MINNLISEFAKMGTTCAEAGRRLNENIRRMAYALETNYQRACRENPRIKYLATHHRSHRVRKKNMKRLRREAERGRVNEKP